MQWQRCLYVVFLSLCSLYLSLSQRLVIIGGMSFINSFLVVDEYTFFYLLQRSVFWDSLPDHLKHCISFSYFKHKIKQISRGHSTYCLIPITYICLADLYFDYALYLNFHFVSSIPYLTICFPFSSCTSVMICLSLLQIRRFLYVLVLLKGGGAYSTIPSGFLTHLSCACSCCLSFKPSSYCFVFVCV